MYNIFKYNKIIIFEFIYFAEGGRFYTSKYESRNAMFVTINEEKCIGCNACIRVCPVHDANKAKLAEDGQHSIITIDTEKCISCGACVKGCVHGARSYVDDTESFFYDLKSGKNITVLVAPAFRLTEPDADAMLAHLRKMGVKLIHDVSFGADICTYMHIKAVKEGRCGKIISQPCPAFVEYVLKHKQSLIPALSPVHSPFGCGAVYLKKYENVNGPMAFLSPCIAKKFELQDTGLADYNVTFKRFAEYMRKNCNYDRSARFEFDNTSAYCGKIYPRPGGLKDCLQHAVPGLDVRNCEGEHLYPTLNYYEASTDADKPMVLDVLNCANGCISGPGTNYEESRVFTYMSRASRVGNEAFTQREKQASKYSLKTDKQFQWFEKHLKFEDFVRKYTPKNANSRSVSEVDIRKAYDILMKETYQDQNFDCHACGYESCRQMAIAIARGVNIPENCHQYVVKLAKESQSNALYAQQSVEDQSQRIVSAVSEISGNIEKICSDTDIINQQCSQNNDEMESVKKMIEQLDQKCSEINAAVSGIVEVNARYREMSEAISSITEQTHILSINASVEAARAGELGKSFAVVAQEIRSLASSTKDTTGAVEENDKFVKQETDKVLQTAKEIEDIITNLDNAMKVINSNIVQTSETGAYIKNVAESIRSTASVLQG